MILYPSTICLFITYLLYLKYKVFSSIRVPYMISYFKSHLPYLKLICHRAREENQKFFYVFDISHKNTSDAIEERCIIVNNIAIIPKIVFEFSSPA
jgi:hypothetical protein